AKGGQRIERLLFVSSTGVYGDQQGGRVDEDTPAEPDRFSGRILLDGERLARSGPIPAIVLRLGGIYGPGRDRLVREVAEGRALRSAAPVITNRIHRDDAAGALAHLLALKDPEPLYLGVDREPADLGEVITWIARELGLPPPPVATADEARAGRLSRGSKRCSSDRLAASGYTFSYPTFREGYGAMLRARG
ncbi:MAG TPA: SDR family NAD(P)-dependent oxidoreductase, partial [Thermoanaerobaculia bacterium]|nr:SDR family NAD(P)-dependent oxidoreductase [Thermoanaerobaculia bacterium]